MDNSLKIGIISQARMGSTRLPGKIMKEIGGQPCLKYHTDRLKWSSIPVIIATTTNPNDDVLAAYCEQENLPYYRGDEQNVLSRFYHCARENELDIIIRVCSDQILIDGNIIKQGVDQYIQHFRPNLFLTTKVPPGQLADGFCPEIFNMSMLTYAYENATEQAQCEHVTTMFHKEERFHKEGIDVQMPLADRRISLDTPEDYECFKTIIEQYAAAEKGVREILEIIEKDKIPFQ